MTSVDAAKEHVPNRFIQANIAFIRGKGAYGGRTYQNVDAKVFFNQLIDLFNDEWQVEMYGQIVSCYPTRRITFIPSPDIKVVLVGFTAMKVIPIEGARYVMNLNGEQLFPSDDDYIDDKSPLIPLTVTEPVRGTIWLEHYSQLKANELRVDTGKTVEIIPREDIRVIAPMKIDRKFIHYKEDANWEQGVTYGDEAPIIDNDGRILILPETRVAQEQEIKQITVTTPDMQIGNIMYKSFEEFRDDHLPVRVRGEYKAYGTATLTFSIPRGAHTLFRQAPGDDVETIYSDRSYADVMQQRSDQEFMGIDENGILTTFTNEGLRRKKEDFLKEIIVISDEGQSSQRGRVFYYCFDDLGEEELFVRFLYHSRSCKTSELFFVTPNDGAAAVIETDAGHIKGECDLDPEMEPPPDATCISNGKIVHGRFVAFD